MYILYIYIYYNYGKGRNREVLSPKCFPESKNPSKKSFSWFYLHLSDLIYQYEFLSFTSDGLKHCRSCWEVAWRSRPSSSIVNPCLFRGRYTANGDKTGYFKKTCLELTFSGLQLNGSRTTIHVEILPSSAVRQKRKASTETEW